MLFTEPAFLFVFLPVLLGLYAITPRALRNVLLTAASLLFYTLGEWRFLPFMIASIAVNYGFALWIESTRTYVALVAARDPGLRTTQSALREYGVPFSRS